MGIRQFLVIMVLLAVLSSVVGYLRGDFDYAAVLAIFSIAWVKMFDYSRKELIVWLVRVLGAEAPKEKAAEKESK